MAWQLVGNKKMKKLEHFDETIGIYENALSEQFCDNLIKEFESPKYKSKIRQGQTFSGVNPKAKTSFDMNLLDSPDLSKYTDEITRVSNSKINNYILKWGREDQYDPNTLFGKGTYYPSWNMQKYERGSGHYKSCHVESNACYPPNEGRGYRIFAVMFYLNTVLSGGETNFLYSDLNVQPKAGTFLCWPAPWPWVHSGSVPISHDKYIVTTWLQGIWANDFIYSDYPPNEK
mgnify:FL=1